MLKQRMRSLLVGGVALLAACTENSSSTGGGQNGADAGHGSSSTMPASSQGGSSSLAPGSSRASSSGPAPGSSAGSPDGGTADAGGTDAGGGDGGWSCSGTLEVTAQVLKTESISRLRTFFGETTGLDDGALYYRDGVTSVNSCPIYDQSAVVYSVEAPERLVPPELMDTLEEGSRPRVHYVWGLNGYGKIYYSEDRGLVAGSDGQSWGYDRSPLDACKILKTDVTPTRAQEVRAELQALTTTLPVSLLAEIGIICWGPGLDLDSPLAMEQTGAEHQAWLDANAVAARVRSMTEFTAEFPLEWSTISYGFEMFLADPVAVTTQTIQPQCLRTLSADYLNDSELQIFASLPSFPAPYGDGWLTNPDTARCQD